MPRLSRALHDSVLGSWQFWTLVPRPPLARAVQSLWALDASDAYSRERLLPRDTVELIINLRAAPHRLLSGPRLSGRTFSKAWIAGLQEAWLDVESPSNSRLIGVRFRPGGFYQVFGLPAHHLLGKVIDLDDIIGPDAEHWRTRLLEGPDMETRLAWLEGWLAARLVSADQDLHGAVTLAIRELNRTHGATPIRAVAREAGISHKHLIDLFRSEVGLSPKTFARVLRFQTVLRNMGPGSGNSWARCAHALGFFDQAHLNLEFRTFSGRTPTEFLRARGPDGDSIVLDNQLA